MEIDVIGVPLWQGCGRPGPEEGPGPLMENGLKELIEKNGHRAGSWTMLPQPPQSPCEDEGGLSYAPSVLDCCRRLEAAVDRSLAAGHFPLVLGGDHALAIGSIAGLNRHIPADDLTVIWVDAHTDINTAASSDSHHIHGMPVSACLGEGDPRLVDGFGRERQKLHPRNLFYIGARSVDDPEWDILRAHNIRVYTMEEVRERGMDAVVREILDQIKTPRLHVSFDVDFMDAAEFSATGLPIPDGPSVADTHLCLGRLLSCGRVCSMDFVEYSPSRDNGERSGLKVCMELLDTCLKSL